MPTRIELDAGEVKKGQNRPNLPCFEPGFVLEDAKRRLGRRNRAMSGFKPAQMPTRVLDSATMNRILLNREGCPSGWWAANPLDRREVMAAYEHRLRLVETQARLRAKAGASR